ncbi:MAG: hypothetical protein B7Z37_13580 [Verrucomicrobia bacterium 12-59-8]|nr:MAG: hypothetical protein B7Z37_13580 [Verrucomicrobia bacterium 12-59-8]
MTHPSIADNDPPRRSRARRRETMINAVATLLGCMALVIMIATVVRVVMVKLWESARVNPDYVQSVYDKDMERRWSGKAKENPALLNEISETLPQDGSYRAAVPPVAETLPPRNVSTVSVSPQVPTSRHPVIQSVIHDIDSKRLKIEHTVRGFFESANVDQLLAFARDPERVRPLMENYYQSHPHTPLEWKTLGWVLPVEEPGYLLGYAQAIFANAEPVSLIIEEMTDGTFQVDWESSVRYGEIDWKEFIKTQPSEPKLLRVIASKPQNIPSDAPPQGSEMLEIKHPDDNDVIYAYFDRKDPKFQPLLQQLQSGNWKDVPLTLRLCYPGPAGGGKNARIAEIEGKGWLILHGTRS